MASTSSHIRVYPSNCEPCRKRKSRCNRVKPCANCELRGISDKCYVKAPRIESASVSARSSNTASSRVAPPRQSHPSPHPQTDQSRNLSRSNLAAAVPSTPSPATSTPASSSSSWVRNLIDSRPRNTLISTSSPSNTATNLDKLEPCVHWKDVSHHLPSATLCQQFLLFFFDELVADVSFVSRHPFLRKTTALLQDVGTLTRPEMAMFFWILSYSSLIAPPKHPLRSSFIDLDKSANQWREVARLFQSNERRVSPTRNNRLLEVALCVMEGMWYTYQSDFESSWVITGVGIRKAAALHLFSGVHNHNSDNLIITSHLTQKLLVMDRWIAFADLRPLGIHTSDIDLPEMGEAEMSIRAKIEQVQINLLETARSVTLQAQSGLLSKEEKYSGLRALLQSIDDESSRAIARYTAETPIHLDPTHCVREGSAPHAAVLLSWLASCAFIACSTATRFSAADKDAPSDVTRASFDWANNMMALVPSIHAIHLQGKQALRISRIANHLFYALRALFLALAGQDIQPRSVNNAAHLLPSSDWPESVGDTAIRATPQQDTTNLSSPAATHQATSTTIQENFRVSMLLLKDFSAVNCKTATRALNLINSVLSRNPALSSKLDMRPVERASDVADIDSDSITIDSSDYFHQLFTARNDDGASFDPGSLSQSQETFDDSLWQTSDFDFDGFLARLGDAA